MSTHHFKRAGILLGQVIGTKMKKTAKVRVERLVMDKYLMQYFPRRTNVFAHDAQEEAKEGDVVLVKQLPLRRSKQVKYNMERIIYSQGNATDPITGRKCDAYAYWDNVDGPATDERGSSSSHFQGSQSDDGQSSSSEFDSRRQSEDGTTV